MNLCHGLHSHFLGGNLQPCVRQIDTFFFFMLFGLSSMIPVYKRSSVDVTAFFFLLAFKSMTSLCMASSPRCSSSCPRYYPTHTRKKTIFPRLQSGCVWIHRRPSESPFRCLLTGSGFLRRGWRERLSDLEPLS